MKKEEKQSLFTLSKEECEKLEVHLTDTLISGFDGKICKRCLRK
jgi:hypothetical protein